MQVYLMMFDFLFAFFFPFYTKFVETLITNWDSDRTILNLKSSCQAKKCFD